MPLWKRPAARFEGVVVSVFSKPDCHLCDVAKAQLGELQARLGFRLEQVDISQDAALLAEYGTRIPLIWVNGQLVCKFRVDEKALSAAIHRAAGH